MGGVSYTFLRDPSRVPVTANTESLADLLAGFFALYADLDLSAHALSVVWGGTFHHPGDAPLHVQNPLDLELNVTKNVSREEVCRLGGEAARAGRLLQQGGWWELLLGEGVPQPQVKPISVRQLFDEDERSAAGQGAPPTPAVDAVRLEDLLAGREAAQADSPPGRSGAAAKRTADKARRRWEAPAPFSGLRLTVDGEAHGAERVPTLATVAAAAAAARRRKEAEAAAAAAAARDRQMESEAVALLDATANKRPAKRKKKKRGSQAGS